MSYLFRKLYFQQEWEEVAGWFLLTLGLVNLLVEWYQNLPLSLIHFFLLMVGIWLVVRQSSVFGLSDSTLQLLQEERAVMKVTAQQAHKSFWLNGKLPQGLTRFSPKVTLSCLVGGILFSSVYSWAVYRFIEDPLWQTVSFLILVITALGYGLRKKEWGLSALAAGVTYLILLGPASPLLAILMMSVLSFVLGNVAWRHSRWTLLLLIVLATYFSLIRWLTYFPSFPIRKEHVLMAELVLAFGIYFSLPFIYRRRQAQEREIVRMIVFSNSIAFTLLSTWFSYQLAPGKLLLSYAIVLLLSAIFGCLAWLYRGRFSYAKYFFVAALGSLLAASVVFFEPIAVIMAWFMASVVILTVGFVLQSYSARLLGLFTLLGTVIHYLTSILPEPILTPTPTYAQEKVWIGILLSSYLIVVGSWFRHLDSRGPEERYRPLYVLSLHAAGVVTILSLIIVEVAAGL